MKGFLLKLLIVFLPYLTFGGNTNYWLIRETNLWFVVATSPTIIVGQFVIHEEANELGTLVEYHPKKHQPGIFVKEVIKGPKNMERLCVGMAFPKEDAVLTNSACIFFSSHAVDPLDMQYAEEMSFAPIHCIPATLDSIQRVKDEVRSQSDEATNFADLVSSFSVPFDEETGQIVSNIVQTKGETDAIKQLCAIDPQRIPALLCLITNDIPLMPTTLSFINCSDDSFEPIARYEVSSTVGMISVIADRLLGMGIFSAYSDTTPSERKHLQDMWKVYVLHWLEQSKKLGCIPRPAIVWEPKAEGNAIP